MRPGAYLVPGINRGNKGLPVIRGEIISFLGKGWTRMQELIDGALETDVELLGKVNRSLLSRSGKQLRPMLCLLSAGLCGGVNESSCCYAAASEMLHNATLMHDDVVDGSSLRRGAPTLSAVLGPSAAVLIGDFWLSKAVKLIVGVPDNRKVIRMFTKTLMDLSEGEMLQLQKSSDASTTEEDYLKIIYCKTASLFESACISGAVSSGASDERVEAVRSYAVALGCAFQIKDDILDYVGDEGLGKPLGADLREGKITLPLLGAFRNLPEREAELRETVKSIPAHPECCSDMVSTVLSAGGVAYAAARLDEFVAKAVHALEIFEDSPQKEYLAGIARYNAFRTV